MTARTAVFESGPITFEVFEAVAGGQLVVPGTAGDADKVGVAGADAINCLGMSVLDALPAGTSTDSTDASGFLNVSAAVVSENTTVARRGCYRLDAAGSFVLGDFVKCAADGKVVKWVDGTDDQSMKVGQCVDPAGGTNGGTSLIDISIG